MIDFTMCCESATVVTIVTEMTVATIVTVVTEVRVLNLCLIPQYAVRQPGREATEVTEVRVMTFCSIPQCAVRQPSSAVNWLSSLATIITLTLSYLIGIHVNT